MMRVQSTTGEFARRGFDAPAAAAATWARWSELVGDEPPIALDAFSLAADRDRALDVVARLGEHAPDRLAEVVAEPQWLDRLLLVAGASSALGQFLARHPDELELLRREPPARDAQGWRDFYVDRLGISNEMATGVSDDLRRAHHAALVEIAVRDLSAPDPLRVVDSVARELAHAADAVLHCALAIARTEVADWRAARLAILAMGKTGAEELNYLSDVDVIYVAEPTEGHSLDEGMRAATSMAAAVARICSAHTAQGTIWEVDAGLRPEGKAGPLVRTISSCRAYYAKWAKNWEFQALLKARPSAGDLELGEEFCAMVAPLVWAAGEREGFVAEVRAMRVRVVSLIPANQAAREIKLGEGGLRDTEFAVQLLQLVHGRADESLRVRGTFTALAALVASGYIGRSDGGEMEEAYRLQRVLEHRVQLRQLRRTHLMPDDERVVATIARSIGLNSEDMQKKWRRSTLTVLRLQRQIFFSPLLEMVSAIPAEGLRLSPEAAQARMRALGFSDPRSALAHIQALTKGSTRRAGIQRQLLPAMLGWFAEGPNPDFGLLAFRQLSESLGDTSWYLRALRDEGWMAHRLARVASSSRYVVDLMKRAPEMVQMLASSEELQPRSTADLTEAMRRAANRHADEDRSIASVRGLRRRELCRIALADVLGNADVRTVGLALSDLASASVDAALAIAFRTIDSPPVGVVALGSWGGNEMSYSSDADAMFVVCDDTDAAGLAAATELVRRAAAVLGKPGPEPALVLDSDLRPEGKGGPQVRTVASYATYYKKWSSTWEAQAMLRARPGAGDLSLAAAVIRATDHRRYPDGGLTEVQTSDIRRLKSRMEKERIPRGVPKERHLKLGSGGLSDIEWTVQLLQLRHAHDHPQLRTPGTLDALAAAATLELVTERQAQDLRAAWEHISRLRNAMMLVRGRASDALPADFRELAAISDVIEYGPHQSSQMLEDTRRLMRRAFHVVDELFWQ
ncbi:MAG: bifunctional [glutamine synthetase] adenylyltransferase/[glutamine synthetase]-adenylyl-L-tyrosine phosphorylase [Arachnia sp.]